MRLDQRSVRRRLGARAQLLMLTGATAFALVVTAAGILTYKADGFAWLTWEWQRTRVLELMAELGNGAVAPPEGSVRTLALRLPRRWIASVTDTETVLPQLKLDIRFKHVRKIYHRREQALERGILIQEKNDLVPGTLRIDKRNVRIKLRLKGDWTDHLEGDKWSFRIETRDGDQVLGMRRFSLQHPKVRGFQSEIVYLQLLRRLGVLAPRYQFVNVVLNGRDLGVMALEEHFSKEILESQSRREGVIVRFDESLLWSSTDGALLGFQGTYDDFRNVPVDGFRLKKIAASSALSKQYEVAVGLLRGFVERRLPAAEVFDPETTGKYLAVTEFVGSRHPTRWHNQRFYLNPITLKFEPIGFDADLHNRIGSDALVSSHEPMVVQILEDPRIQLEFRKALNALIAGALHGDLLADLGRAETEHLRALRKEFYLIERFPYDYLHDRAEFLQTVPAQAFTKANYPQFAGVAPPTSYPQAMQAYYFRRGDKTVLQLGPSTPHAVAVGAILVTPAPMPDDSGAATAEVPRPTVNTLGSPLVLLPRVVDEIPRFKEIEIDAISDGATLELSGQIGAPPNQVLFRQTAIPYSPTLETNPIPKSPVSEQLLAHPFLTLPPGTRDIHIRPGSWNVRESIIVPPGFSLLIEAGTTLAFDADAGLYSKGPLRFEGSADSPIILTGSGAQTSWPGVAVLQAHDLSVWKHVHVQRTHGVAVGAWRLTGGVNFYQSPVNLYSSRFSGNLGEDALNIISSQFELINPTIENAASDGFDCDYCNGLVRDGLFQHVRGDAIDISVSEIEISGTRFGQVADKAISVGEQSRAQVSNIIVEHAGSGAVAKDGSTLMLRESTISNTTQAGLMAYVKKPEFGPARVDAMRTQLVGDFASPIVQTGSVIVLNGSTIPAQPLDVDKLYATVMKPSIER